MADRIEREINEILEKLESLPDDGVTPDRRPISIAEHREDRQRRMKPPGGGGVRKRLPTLPLNPTHALLAGAGTVVGGLILSNLWAPLIWAAFAGVAVFIGGFIAAFLRTPRPGPESRDGVFWRDRYISYEPTRRHGPIDRLKRRFRR